MPLKAGDKFPDGVKFEWTPIDTPDPTVCGMPQEYDASSDFQGKKVVLVSVPGAFTPGCQGRHLPPIIENLEKITSKADKVIVIAINDSWVMNAWGKVNGIKEGSKIFFMSDTKTAFSEKYGWMASTGDRTGRYAMIIDKDGTVSYAENEKSPREVSVSGADAILGKL